MMTKAVIYEHFKKGFFGSEKLDYVDIILEKPRSKSSIKTKKYTIRNLGDEGYIIEYLPLPTGSLGVTSKGTVSGRRYNPRPKTVVVEEYELKKDHSNRVPIE